MTKILPLVFYFMAGITKHYTGYLILGWKTGKVRYYKRPPRKKNYSDIMVRLDVNVIFPEEKEIVAKGEITLNDAKIQDIFVSEIAEVP